LDIAALKQALDELANKFGKRHVVVKARLDYNKGPSVKADKNSLENLPTDMFNCHATLFSGDTSQS